MKLTRRRTVFILSACALALCATVAILTGSPRGAAPALAQPSTATPVSTMAPPLTPTPTPLPDLIVDASRVELSGRHEYGRVILRNRARLEIQPYSGSVGTGQIEIIADSIEIDRSSSIIGDEFGYRGQERNPGEGPGGGEGGRRTFDGGAGGAYGGQGGDGVLDGVGRPGATGGRQYGTRCGEDLEMGSSGGAPGSADSAGDPGKGGNGGAAVSLIANTILITGTITVNGEDGLVVRNDAAGGGAGGGIQIYASLLEQTGRLQANGGDGGVTDDGGGGGGGGRIKIRYVTGSVSRAALKADGGKGDGNGYRNDGGRGSICIETIDPTPTPSPSPTVTPSPTPLVTDTPIATATHTPTPTPTATDTPLPTPTPTATPTPSDLYIPISLREHCPDMQVKPLEIAIVIDASTSMLGETRAGRTKLEAAIEAGIGIARIVRRGGPLRIAVIRFAGDAVVVAPLGDDRATIESALRSIEASPGSRLDEGILAGSRAIDERTSESGLRRIIVLTDGLPSPSGPADVRRAADAVRAHGVVIDAIGIGLDVDAELLTDASGDPSRYHAISDAEDLVATFEELIRVPPACGGTPIWPSGGR